MNVKRLADTRYSATLLLAIALGGCTPKPEEKPAQKYSLHGEIVRLEEQGHLVAIRHEEIKGWMGAMTMEFPVKDSADFGKLSEGQPVNATVYVQGLNYWVANVQNAPAPVHT